MSCTSCLRNPGLGWGYINQPGTTTLLVDDQGGAELIGAGLGFATREPVSSVGGVRGLGLVTSEVVGPLGATTNVTDWQVKQIAAKIKLLRLEGKSDAEISSGLRSGSITTTILGAATAEMISAAFVYADTGKLGPEVSCQCDSGQYDTTCCPATQTQGKSGRKWPWIVGGAVALAATIGIVVAVRR